MATLQIKLKQKYKSFEPATFNFASGLIILSGVNGSGKTQLIDIIKGHEKDNFLINITREITLDNQPVEDNEIAHKSFRDYHSLGELSSAHTNNFSQAKDQIFSWYQQTRLEYNPNYNTGYKDGIKKAQKLLVDYYGQEKFQHNKITRDEINKAIPSNFILYQDDIFTNKIGEIFWSYATFVYRKLAAAGATGEKLDRSTLPKAPWTILNEIFESLNFGYRFKEDYYRIDDEISDQPAIYPIDRNGKVLLEEKRLLNELSDGEKALISLSFAILATEQRNPKILLLDEYDAPLNPSLIESFFKLLNEFFIAKGITVIIVTHSAATLSLAPDNVNFYEVYRPNDEQIRILEVDREQYADLRRVNKRFYDRISDQQLRVKELTIQNDELNQLLGILKKKEGKLQIVSEGNNIGHIEKAITILAPNLIDKIEFVRGAESSTGKQQMKAAFEVMSNLPLSSPILFIWDVDANNSVINLKENGRCRKFCFSSNENNAKILTGIENLYPESFITDDLYQTKVSPKPDGGTSTITSLNKSKFEEKVKNEEDPSIFAKFSQMVEIIERLANENYSVE